MSDKIEKKSNLGIENLFNSLSDAIFGATLISNDMLDIINNGSVFSYNKDGSLNIVVDVPGIHEEDLSVSIMPSQDTESNAYDVSVRGSTKTETYSRSIDYRCSIPEGFKLVPLHKLENGVLILTFPLLNEENKDELAHLGQ